MTQLYLTVNLKLKNVIVIVMILLPFVANGLFLNGKSFGNMFLHTLIRMQVLQQT